MTALSEALLTAQRGALAAMQKAYLRDVHTEAQILELMDKIGCTDKADQMLLVESLHVMKNLGTDAPVAPTTKPPAEHEPASEAQWKLIRRMADERGVPAPDQALSKAEASKVIEQIKAGSYVADEWAVPF